jgi:integrase
MTHRSRGDRGTYLIDVWIGRKRYRFATGIKPTTKGAKALLRDYRTMVDALRIRGRIDLLDGLVDGLYAAPELMTAFRLDDFDRLPRAEDIGDLKPKWETWATAAKREKARYAWDYLAGCKTMRDIPKAVQAMRDALPESRAFGLYKAEVQSFLRDTVGKAHPTYRAVAAIPGFKRQVRERGRPLGRDEVRLLKDTLDRKAYAAFWTMVATGAGVKEYLEDGIEVLEDRVLVHGQKNARRDRVVPSWAPLLKEPPYTEYQMRFRLKKMGVGLYDARRTFARWCEEAGIRDSHIEAYMGHSPKSMTRLYQRGELPGQLADDAAKLREFLKDSPDIYPDIELEESVR